MAGHAASGTLPPDRTRLSGPPIGGPESRVRSVTADEAAELPASGRSHAGRHPATGPLSNRLEQPRQGAQPASDGRACGRPGQREGDGGSPVSPAASPEPFRPSPHGTPGRFGKPEGDRH
ncbi:hypothetical protein ACIF8T_10735 [Streptomyces sp. NPDC085946]|uniref:hypothetical protein n=1 Tax=Streptomyces sp. NPDC085946 TaxID=3365744 RepID=UPI0037D2F134